MILKVPIDLKIENFESSLSESRSLVACEEETRETEKKKRKKRRGFLKTHAALMFWREAKRQDRRQPFSAAFFVSFRILCLSFFFLLNPASPAHFFFIRCIRRRLSVTTYM